MKDNFKNKVFATTILLAVISSSSNALALKDATQINNTTGFVPNSDTRAARAEQSAATALSKANGVEITANAAFDSAQEANGIAKGTIQTLVNPNGCVYNDSFNCSENNLSHQYKSKSWTSPGTYRWTVPAGITSVYFSLKGSEAGGVKNVRKHTIMDGTSGGSISLKSASTATAVNGLDSSISGVFTVSAGATSSKKISTSPGSVYVVQLGRGPRIGYDINNDYGYYNTGDWYAARSDGYRRFTDGILYQGENASLTVQY